MPSRPPQYDRAIVAEFLHPFIAQLRRAAEAERELVRVCKTEDEADRHRASAEKKEKRADRFKGVAEWIVAPDVWAERQ